MILYFSAVPALRCPKNDFYHSQEWFWVENLRANSVSVFMMIQGEGEIAPKEFYVSRIKTQKDQKNIS